MRYARTGVVSVLMLWSCGGAARDKAEILGHAGSSGSGGSAAAPAPGETSGAGGGAIGDEASGGFAGKLDETTPCEPRAPSTRAPGDPAVPGTLFGPLMGGSLSTPGRAIELLGTAAAVRVANGSHLFFTTTPPAEAPVVYLSVVIPEADWPTGVYLEPLTGALEVRTSDNCSYRLDLTRPQAIEFRLEVTQSTQQGDHFYLRGRLDAQLPSLDGRSPMALHMTIN